MFSVPYFSEPNGCSLAYILEKDVLASRWDGDLPSYMCWNLIRFLLQELFKHENDYGYLDPNYIFVTSGEAKVAQPRNAERQPRPLRMEFISLIRDMLGNENNQKRLELTHFIIMAGNRRVTFEMLFHHPLLQSTSDERYFFPIRVMLYMNDNERRSERRSWRQEYRESKERPVDFKSAIKAAKYKVGLESVYKLNQRPGCRNTVMDVLDFSKNVVNHINEYEHLQTHGTKRMTENEIVNDLTRMFPTRLIDLYEFLVLHRQISMAFLSRR